MKKSPTAFFKTSYVKGWNPISHNTQDKLTLVTDPKAHETTYDERTNGKGHLTGMTDSSWNTTFDYDNRAQLSEKFSTINGHVFPLTYGYSTANSLTSVIYPTARTVTYIRNSTGKVEEVSTRYGLVTNIIIRNIFYLPFGSLRLRKLGIEAYWVKNSKKQNHLTFFCKLAQTGEN